jgi:large subunit ribosomal protein L3
LFIAGTSSPLLAEITEKVGDEPGLNPPPADVLLNLAGVNRKKMKGIIGKKIGMTSIFDPGGRQTACTIIEAGPCVVTQVKTKETDGYTALQLAFGDKNDKHSNKAEKNHYSKASTAPKKFVKEFRDFAIEKNIGETVTVDIFAEGDKVEVVGTSKGKGFQGVVKRHGFSGVGGASHGQHDRSRAPGSLGNSSDASRVMKGMRMAGRTGGDRVKLKGLKVLKVFPDKNYILISGAVPGHNGSIVLIQK